MELNTFQAEIARGLPQIKVCFNEPLSKHTSFRIGGPAEAIAFPTDTVQLAEILKVASLMDIKPAILGAGTNVLAPDEGIRGLIVCLKDCFDGIEELPNSCLRVMAGVTMTRAAVYAANHGLSGMEFAHGIPGTVGGGVFMNAGAYGGEISQICQEVTVMSSSGELRVLKKQNMEFSYRHSILENSADIVVSAVFALVSDSAESIKSRMKELLAKRSASQPLDYPSAGSAFKRPTGGYAAALIDQAGLKGFRIGNAAISEKHAGFTINLGGATAADVRALLSKTSDCVYQKTGIRLEPEIRIW